MSLSLIYHTSTVFYSYKKKYHNEGFFLMLIDIGNNFLIYFGRKYE